MAPFAPSAHLKTWIEDRAKYVRIGLEERLGIPGTAYTALDISASTTKVKLRAWKGPTSDRVAADLFLDEEITKITDGTGGNDAVVAEFVTIISGTGRVGPVEFAIIIVDEAVGSQPTPSTYQETVYARFSGSLSASVQP